MEKRLIRYTKFAFTVDEGKERLNLSREKNKGMHRRRKVEEKSCVTWAGASNDLTSRINGKKTHTHITFFFLHKDVSKSSTAKYSHENLKHDQDVVPTRAVAQSFTLQGRHGRFVGDSAFHTSFRGAPLLVGDAAEMISSSATSKEFDAM